MDNVEIVALTLVVVVSASPFGMVWLYIRLRYGSRLKARYPAKPW